MDLTPQEEARLAELDYSPTGGFREVTTVVGLLNNVQDRALMQKVIVDGVRAIRAENLEAKQPLDCQFFYMHALKFYFRHRSDEKGLDNAKFFCLQQINLAEKSIPAFKKERWDALPSHTGYEQLCIICQKEKRYEAVMELCQQAKRQGWAGDWDKRYAKAEKSLRAN